MKQLESCGFCGHKPSVSVYFSIRTGECTYYIECPCCHHDEVVAQTETEAINKWNYLYPSLFALSN